MNRISFTAPQIKSIVRRYKGGESSISIANDYDVSANAILRVLRAQRVKIRTRGRYAMA